LRTTVQKLGFCSKACKERLDRCVRAVARIHVV
jgi:hypothetical protein